MKMGAKTRVLDLPSIFMKTRDEMLLKIGKLLHNRPMYQFFART